MEGLKDPEQFSRKQFTFLGSILPTKDGAVAFFGGGCRVPAAASGAPSRPQPGLCCRLLTHCSSWTVRWPGCSAAYYSNSLGKDSLLEETQLRMLKPVKKKKKATQLNGGSRVTPGSLCRFRGAKGGAQVGHRASTRVTHTVVTCLGILNRHLGATSRGRLVPDGGILTWGHRVTWDTGPHLLQAHGWASSCPRCLRAGIGLFCPLDRDSCFLVLSLYCFRLESPTNSPSVDGSAIVSGAMSTLFGCENFFNKKKKCSTYMW